MSSQAATAHQHHAGSADGTPRVMHAERVDVKIFATRLAEDPLGLIPVFHRWIREDKVPGELLIDVADYTHVWRGPGVMLVGHGMDLYYDFGEDRPGLLFSRKRAFKGTFEARLVDALNRALQACRDLSAEGLAFDASEILVRVPDRLHAPNDDEAFGALVPLLEAAVRTVFGDAVVMVIEREGAGTRQPLTARLRLEGELPSL